MDAQGLQRERYRAGIQRHQQYRGTVARSRLQQGDPHPHLGGQLGDPSDIAGTALLLASPAVNCIAGSVFNVDGCWLAR